MIPEDYMVAWHKMKKWLRKWNDFRLNCALIKMQQLEDEYK